MIAAITSTATSGSRHHRPCPNCGAVHYCPETAFSDAYSWTITLPASPTPDQEWAKWKSQYDAEGASRKLALGRLPQVFPPTQVREPNVRHLVHRMRCPARRPCLTLLQRVLRARGRR